MKTLIFQVSIGASAYKYNKGYENEFEKYFIPSVKRYCEKYNYDYKMITEWPEDHDPWFFNRSSKPRNYDYTQGGKNKASTLVRYLNMNQSGYDRIVSLDNDIFITDTAPILPDIKGHCACRDVGKSWETMRKSFKLPKDTFVNAGVQMVDISTGKKIHKDFANICDNKIPPPLGYNSDQSYMNHWRSQNHESSTILGEEWNYFIGSHISNRIENTTGKNFLHYAGEGRGMIERDIDNGTIQ